MACRDEKSAFRVRAYLGRGQGQKHVATVPCDPESEQSLREGAEIAARLYDQAMLFIMSDLTSERKPVHERQRYLNVRTRPSKLSPDLHFCPGACALPAINSFKHLNMLQAVVQSGHGIVTLL